MGFVDALARENTRPYQNTEKNLKAVRDTIKAAKPEELQDLWESGTGTCTFWLAGQSTYPAS